MATSPARRGVQLCDDDLLELFGFCSISELASRLSLVCSQFWRCACPKMFEQNPRFVELTVGAIYETEVAEGGQQRQVFRENTIYARRVVGAEEADRQEVPEWKAGYLWANVVKIKLNHVHKSESPCTIIFIKIKIKGMGVEGETN